MYEEVSYSSRVAAFHHFAFRQHICSDEQCHLRWNRRRCQSGALIPGVEVTARNVATGIVNTITNEAGAYQFPSLQTGTYQVSATLAGFQTATNNNVTLGGSEQVRLNFVLRVGDIATTVDVTADIGGGALLTTSSSIGTVLPEMQVRELPTGDRNVLELLRGVGGAGPTEDFIDGYFAGG